MLKIRGIEPKFLDFVDSYRDEFASVVEMAKTRYSTLLDVHLIEDDLYRDLEHRWKELGYESLDQIFFDFEEGGDYFDRRLADDTGEKGVSRISGCTVGFLDPDGNLKTAIFIPNRVKLAGFEHVEYKFSARLVALCHEIGHVDDMESNRFFNIENRTFDMIGGEVYANVYGLKLLAERGLKQGYDMLLNALSGYAELNDESSICQIGKQVVDEFQSSDAPLNWVDQLDNLTPEELRRLGENSLSVIRE